MRKIVLICIGFILVGLMLIFTALPKVNISMPRFDISIQSEAIRQFLERKRSINEIKEEPAVQISTPVPTINVQQTPQYFNQSMATANTIGWATGDTIYMGSQAPTATTTYFGGCASCSTEEFVGTVVNGQLVLRRRDQ